MRPTFVPITNVKRFLDAVNRLIKPEDRGDKAAGMLLVQGRAGYGKSATGAWWANHHRAVILRIKAAGTPHWVLTDLVTELGESKPARSCEAMFGQATAVLSKDPRPIVVDEVESGLRDLKILETIRDVSDFAEVPVVFLGREYVWGRLSRHSQFRTRIGRAIEFDALTSGDVALLCGQLAEIEIAPDLVEQIHLHCEGQVREAVKAIRTVELVAAKRKARGMKASDMAGHDLTPRLMKGSARRSEDEIAS